MRGYWAAIMKLCAAASATLNGNQRKNAAFVSIPITPQLATALADMRLVGST